MLPRRYFILFFLLLLGNLLKAQVDPHFSQYYAYALWMNPAYISVNDEDYKVTLIQRNQSFGNINTFSTSGLSAEFKTNNNLNFGINMLSQIATSGGYGYLNGSLSISYTGLKLGLNEDHHLIFGMNMGMLNRRFDSSKFELGDQFLPNVGFSPSIPSADVFDVGSSTVFDAGAGIAYFNKNPLKKINLYGGFSVNHLTKPKDPFLSSGVKGVLPMRFMFNIGASTKLSEDVVMIPHLMYARQGNAQERVLGLYFMVLYGLNTDIIFGSNVRYKDAVIPYAGFTFNSFTLGLSYDVNAGLNSLGTRTNTFELSLTFFKRKLSNYRTVRCPVF